MSDKTELPIEWQQLSESKATALVGYTDFNDQQDMNTACRLAGSNGVSMAKAMRDAMEKMLKDDIDRFTEKINNPNSLQEEKNHFKVMLAYTNGIFQKLTSLTPTQDGK
jgi:capsid portal protein